jgi:hypothetical protein
MTRLALALLALSISACDFTRTTAPPAAERSTAPQTADAGPAGIVVGCASIEASECQFVAGRVLAALPAARGRPFDIEIWLSSCAGKPCAPSLAARSGGAFVDYADAGQPIALDLNGPPQAPDIATHLGFNWTDVQHATSARVTGSGPFPFEVSHCGLSHVVDFDGSFWVLAGQLDGEASGLINGEVGQMQLVAPNHAIYVGTASFTAHLARFPGPKRGFICI